MCSWFSTVAQCAVGSAQHLETHRSCTAACGAARSIARQRAGNWFSIDVAAYLRSLSLRLTHGWWCLTLAHRTCSFSTTADADPREAEWRRYQQECYGDQVSSTHHSRSVKSIGFAHIAKTRCDATSADGGRRKSSMSSPGEKLSFGGVRADVNFKLFAAFNGSTGLWSMDVSVSSRSCVPEKGPGPVGLKKGNCCCV